MDAIVLRDRITGSMTDEEFFWFCQENRELRIERNSNLEIIIMSPTNSFSGKINTEILRQLSNWNYQAKTGEVFDSSTGFTLPDRSIYSPDAAWVSSANWNRLSEVEKNSFAPVCPEFVIEIRSKSDDIKSIQQKMETWLRNGTQLGWIVDPIDKQIHVYSYKEPIKVMLFTERIVASEPIAGFELDLSLLKI